MRVCKYRARIYRGYKSIIVCKGSAELSRG